jgi:hypothetical protein
MLDSDLTKVLSDTVTQPKPCPANSNLYALRMTGVLCASTRVLKDDTNLAATEGNWIQARLVRMRKCG